MLDGVMLPWFVLAAASLLFVAVEPSQAWHDDRAPCERGRRRG